LSRKHVEPTKSRTGSSSSVSPRTFWIIVFVCGRDELKTSARNPMLRLLLIEE
jgi:hypothetical protein